MYQSFAEVRAENAVVHEVLSSGGSLEDCVVVLAGLLEKTRQQVVDLAAYAPTRVKCPDGRIVVWRCPEHLIPLTDLSGSETVSKEVK